MTDNARVTELEIKSAYQEDLLQELNQVVVRQQVQIERLEATCQLLHERIKSLQNMGFTVASEPEIPPHY